MKDDEDEGLMSSKAGRRERRREEGLRHRRDEIAHRRKRDRAMRLLRSHANLEGRTTK